jgi:hypothetical protein
MKSATRVLISTFGAFVGLSGIEHGLGELLQGNVPPAGIFFPSWPDAAFFHVLAGEPAITLLPNLLITGILAIFFSTLYLICAVGFVHRKYGGLALIGLSVVMLPVGAGVFPPVLGLLIGLAATRLQGSLTWFKLHLSPGLRSALMKLWPWSFGACLLAWLGMLPGVPVLDYFFGINNPDLIFALLLGMFGFLFLTVISGVARDEFIKP